MKLSFRQVHLDFHTLHMAQVKDLKMQSVLP